MKTYLVEFQNGERERWIIAGRFKANSNRGAIVQFVTTYYGNVIAVRATPT